MAATPANAAGKIRDEAAHRPHSRRQASDPPRRSTTPPAPAEPTATGPLAHGNSVRTRSARAEQLSVRQGSADSAIARLGPHLYYVSECPHADAWRFGPRLSRLVPRLNHARFPFVPEHADRAGRKREASAHFGGDLKPACRKNAQHVSMSENSYIASGSRLDHAPSPFRDLLDGFATRRGARPDGPAGCGLLNLGRR